MFYGNGNIGCEVSDTGLRMILLQRGNVNFLANFRKVGGKLRGGAHLCFPIFGNPPLNSPLRGKILQHGNFRSLDFSLGRRGWGIFSSFEINPKEGDAYRWPLKGFVGPISEPKITIFREILVRKRGRKGFNKREFGRDRLPLSFFLEM